MNVVLWELFLVVFGIILGVIASDPLKKLFTGKYREEKRQKKRVKLLLYIRQHHPKTATTEELVESVFAGKIDVVEVTKLLQEIEEIGLIKGKSSQDQGERHMKWGYVKKD